MEFESFSHLFVVDLEATCDDRNGQACLVPRHEMETIELGGVLVDAATLEPVGEIAQFVRPVRHPRLTVFCTQLTSITQADVDAAPRFPEAMENVRRFLDGRRVLFCSWGDYDRNQLAQDAGYHRLRLPFTQEHVNLKKRFSEALGETKRFGMSGALRRVGLPLLGTHHRGIDDARNIARLLPWVTRRR